MEIIKTNPAALAPNEQHKTLYTHAELLQELNQFSNWKKEAWEEFSKRVSAPEFPCLFSRRAWNSKTIQVLFCESDEHNTYYPFLHGLIAYTDMLNSTPVNKRMFSPLVVFFSPDLSLSMAPHKLGWEVLNWTHEHDVAQWPRHIPIDPEASKWTYCFNGVELFINMSSDKHQVLRNRNLGSRLNFVINAGRSLTWSLMVKRKVAGRLESVFEIVSKNTTTE
ncbi:YqcI/YcgG family protein [Vibrio splendidus]|nr:YqcI/YcgG family protein [Vibrio splendidus]MCW4446255.1 YqcI/YcgG family protein [Vibrio splendidus]